jgi:N-succinyldiaminopimelate aminotransferase
LQYKAARDALAETLADIGFGVHLPAGSYFILADHSAFGFADDFEFCAHLIDDVGVAAIPPSAFYENKAFGKSLVRFAFCKSERTMEAARGRLRALKERRPAQPR